MMKTGLKIKKKATAYTIICAAFLWIFALSLIFLFVYAFVNSLKGIFDYIENPLGLPKKWEWGNYLLIWEYFYIKIGSSGPIYYLEHMFAFGFLYAAGCAAASTAISTLTAYATAQFDYKFSKIVYALVLFTMACPIIGAQASELQMVKTLGIYDTFIGCFVLKSNFLSMYYLVLFALFKGIPKEFDEAARIDGAGEGRIFWRVVMPLVKPAWLTLIIFSFQGLWNTSATVLIQREELKTLNNALSQIVSGGIARTGTAAAAAVIMMVVPIFVFVISQGSIVETVATSGMKD